MLQSEESSENDNSETRRADAEETTQSETDVSENENPGETSAQTTEKQHGEFHLSLILPEKTVIMQRDGIPLLRGT